MYYPYDSFADYEWMDWRYLRRLVKYPDCHDMLLELMTGTISLTDYRVLTLRLGMTGHKPHTLRAIAKIMGVTPERVRQREDRAIRTLRHHRLKWAELDQAFIDAQGRQSDKTA